MLPLLDGALTCAAERSDVSGDPWSGNAATSHRVPSDVFVEVGITLLNLAVLKLANSAQGYHCYFSKGISSHTSVSQLCRLSVCANL